MVFLIHRTDQALGDFDLAIRNSFDRVKAWVREHGGDINSVPAIGIAYVTKGQLQAYECCIPIPDALLVTEHSEVTLKIDHSRPTYEVYWDKTMDFCVPVLS